MYEALLVLHILAATIWVGGHILLSVRYLPKSIASRNAEVVKAFEKAYEPVGIPALIVQVVTGVILSLRYVSFERFLHFSTPMERAISLKLLLLLATIGLAIHARFFIIPKLDSTNLKALAYHILLVTLLAIAFVYVGVSVRWGGI